MKKKCYISGKITGLSIEEYTREFEQAKKEVEEMGYIPVSPIDLPHEHDKEYSSYMKEDLIEMLKCDYIYLIQNYVSSNGCRIEYKLSLEVGIGIIYQRKK